MFVEITYFVHSTTTDNENNLATGHAPGKLSELGLKQASELPEKVDEEFDAFYCSDLHRAKKSAQIAFGNNYDIIEDSLLRECDYGELTQEKAEWSLKDYISTAYPDGESYFEVEARIREFLKFLLENYDGEKIALMAHQAPQLALEVITKDISWADAIEQDWRETGYWQPGWNYSVDKDDIVLK